MRRRSPAAPRSRSSRSPRPRRAAPSPRPVTRARRSWCAPRRQSVAEREARPAGATSPRTGGCSAPRSPLPRGGQRTGPRLWVADGRGRVGAPARCPAQPHPRSHVRRQGLRLFPATRNAERATRGLLAYVCHARASAGVRAMTAFPTVELTVYPYDCDAFGHLNQAALLTLLERARWEALARGPGMALF